MNHQIEITPSSGISSRGYDISQSTPGSSSGFQITSGQNSGLDYNDDVQSSIVLQGPPGTAMTRNGIDIYSPLSGSNKLSGVIGSSSLIQPTVSSFFHKFGQNSQSNSQTITARINKVIKTQRKLIRQQQDLAKEISSWCNVLPNEDSKSFMENFIRILENQSEITESFIKREQTINVQLSNVDKRERRSNELKLKRNKMLIKLREYENRLGDNPVTTLIRENLDELDCSVDIVEDQFVNSINFGLRQSIVEYSVVLQETGTSFRELSEEFIERFHLGPSLSNKENINSGSKNLHRLIVEHNLSNSIQKRPIKSSSGNSFMGVNGQPKYVAISPNQIGKVFENKFDQLNISLNPGRTSPSVKNSSKSSKAIDGMSSPTHSTDGIDDIDDDPPIKPLNTIKANPTVLLIKEEELQSVSPNPLLQQVGPPQIQTRMTALGSEVLNYKKELLKLQQDYKNLCIQYQQQQTEMQEDQIQIQLLLQIQQQEQVAALEAKCHQHQSVTTTTHDHHEYGFNNLMNTFNTPGSLALRPSSQVSNVNHEWNNT